MTRTLSSWTSIAMVAVITYPFIVRGVLHLIGSVFYTKDPYKDGECYLKLINQTNSEHFMSHPLWPHRGYGSDCNAIDYARKQAFENEIEGFGVIFYKKVFEMSCSVFFRCFELFFGSGV